MFDMILLAKLIHPCPYEAQSIIYYDFMWCTKSANQFLNELSMITIVTILYNATSMHLEN